MRILIILPNFADRLESRKIGYLGWDDEDEIILLFFIKESRGIKKKKIYKKVRKTGRKLSYFDGYQILETQLPRRVVFPLRLSFYFHLYPLCILVAFNLDRSLCSITSFLY